MSHTIHSCARRECKLERGTCCLNLFADARVLATNRRNSVPVAMPRTPPPRFSSAVMVADMNARNTSPGTVARAKSSATLVRSNSVSLSSRHTLRISSEHPPGPGELRCANTQQIAWCRDATRHPGQNRGPPLESAGASLVAACVSIRPTLTRLEVPKLPRSTLAAHDSDPSPSLLFLNHRHRRNGSWSRHGVACALDQICPQPSGKIVNSVSQFAPSH